ncbi:Protein CBG08333 [Caenorhabditis briggsae]|uniref:Protein CBG08333 n=1 Tax=Caenorhabditis briggsae TaxID=6238 RepID=A8X6B8_CAEBR|nr:Protein CBG08333 [Caenorhabditis briggsae]CAP28179.1 Protein CBG08333 [Caenorhabditis briggsae]
MPHFDGLFSVVIETRRYPVKASPPSRSERGGGRRGRSCSLLQTIMLRLLSVDENSLGPSARTSLLTACTVFYALFLTIFSLVLELAHLLNDEESRKLNKKDIIFGLYMYGGSLVFFFYMYIVLLLNPRWYSTMDYLGKMFGVCLTRPKVSPSSDSLSSAAATVRKVTHSSPSAGSLFLRLGSVVFGVTGVVYYAFLVFLCELDTNCSALSTSLDVCAIFFIFIQMHFIFCNWKLSITGSHMVARIGTMHLVAANLWTWIRYVLMEEGVMEKEIREVFKHRPMMGHYRNLSFDSSESSQEQSSEMFSSHEDEHDKKIVGSCQAVECFLGSLSEIMFTSIVEYSLIAAAVMYIVWRNIGRQDHGSTYVKRKHQIRVDCSKTTTGLFLGLAFLAVTFTSMVVYYGFTMMNKSKDAAFVYAFTDMFQYVLSTIGVLTAIYQMRALKYFNKKTHIQNSDQELLDQILLSIGLVGELIYSVAGLVGLTGEKQWTNFSFVLLFVHIFRLIQVGTQTFLLHVARSVRMGCEDREAQPGKQAITFLLTANLAIFFMNLFESEKAGVSEIIIEYYGKRSWVFLVRSFSPLTIFYRFHSSVCFAEIWKNVYAAKTHPVHNSATSTATPINI